MAGLGYGAVMGRSREEDESFRYRPATLYVSPNGTKGLYFDHYGSGDEGFEPEIISLRRAYESILARRILNSAGIIVKVIGESKSPYCTRSRW